MNVLKYLESKGIKDNPRIINVTGQATDFYLQTLLEDFKKQLTLTDVVKPFYCWNRKCDGKKCKNQCIGCEYYEEKELKQ